jgi:glycosyltransferase involved in cell wall biosynthesis
VFSTNGSTTSRPLRILQVSLRDTLGGAERVAWNLFQGYAARGQTSWLACGRTHFNHPNVFCVSQEHREPAWVRLWSAVENRLLTWDAGVPGGVRGAWRVSRVACALARPGKWLDRVRGLEDFRFPETRRLLSLVPERPDLVHCHTLHGGYFDLRVLPSLSRQLPVMLTLHDAWLLSGLCWHSFDCDRWKTGCGHCPQLKRFPALYGDVRRDATAENWKRKRSIYQQSRLYVATPSRWLMDLVKQSILAPAVVEARVIPNGVDLSVFHPAANKAAVRAALDIPQEAKVFLFAGNHLLSNQNKDFQTVRDAAERIAARDGEQQHVLLVLGETSPAERVGSLRIHFVPFQNHTAITARYYQAADIYLHAAHADTFPNTVLEALACGTPVVATAVGGIPEQIKGLKGSDSEQSEFGRYEAAEATGVLVPMRDAEAMACWSERLLSDTRLYRSLATNAVRDVRQRFDLQRQIDEYLGWYETIVAGEHRSQGPVYQKSLATG